MIEQSIRETGYTVNVVARALRTKKFNNIGVAIPSFNNLFQMRVVSQMEKILNKHDITILPMSHDGDSYKQKNVISYLMDRTDGIIFSPRKVNPSDFDFYQKVSEKKPLIIINDNFETLKTDRILLNSKQVAYQSIKKFLENGHRNIAMIVGPEDFNSSILRVEGAREAFNEMGLEFDESLVKHSGYGESCGREFCREIIENKNEVTAMFVSNYRNTLAVLSELKEQKMQDRLDVIGFGLDGIESVMESKIPYVYQSQEQIAERAIEIMLRRIANDISDYPQEVEVDSKVRNLDLIKNIK